MALHNASDLKNITLSCSSRARVSFPCQIGEYLLRYGYFGSAEVLQDEAGLTGILDLHVLRQAKEVC